MPETSLKTKIMNGVDRRFDDQTKGLVDGRATLPEGTPRQYSSYCGNYTFDGSTLTTIVDANCDPVRFTVPQVRKVRFEGERMVLTPPPADVNGVKVIRELTWERISPMSL